MYLNRKMRKLIGRGLHDSPHWDWICERWLARHFNYMIGLAESLSTHS